MMTRKERYNFEHAHVDPKKVDHLEMAKAGVKGVRLARDLMKPRGIR